MQQQNGTIGLLDKELNDHIQPKRKFYKTKRFYVVLLSAALASLGGDYSQIIPAVIEIAQGL